MNKIIKTLKKFQWEGIELSIVIRSEPYLSSTENVEVRRVISNVNNGVIPVDFNKNDTLKSIIDKTINFLNEMVLFNSKQMVIDELNKIK